MAPVNELELTRLDAATLWTNAGSTVATFLNVEATPSGEQTIELQIPDLDAANSTIDPGRFVVLLDDERTVIPTQVNLKSGSEDTLELHLPADTLRSGESGLVTYLSQSGQFVYTSCDCIWLPFGPSDSFDIGDAPAQQLASRFQWGWLEQFVFAGWLVQWRAGATSRIKDLVEPFGGISSGGMVPESSCIINILRIQWPAQDPACQIIIGTTRLFARLLKAFLR